MQDDVVKERERAKILAKCQSRYLEMTENKPKLLSTK
jgi:hypothetical protein